MKVTYLTQPTVLHVTPQELYELGVGTIGKLIEAKTCYQAYIGNNYTWMPRSGSIALCNPEYSGDWWGYYPESWNEFNEPKLLFEVTF